MNYILQFARQVKSVARLRPYAAMADCFLVSYPKSGRTWLRYMLSYYVAALHDPIVTVDLASMFSVVPNFDLDPIRGIPAFRYPRNGGHIPKIWVSHHGYDRRLFLDKPVIYIMRDPRDVIVSAYFHATRHKHSFEGDILNFIKDETRGTLLMCNYLNGWAKGLTERRSHILTYEALYADPAGELTRVLRFLGHPVDPSLIKTTVAAGNFNVMQALEKLQGIPGHSYDRNDANSLRMRRGRPGAYDEHLDADALAAVEEICALNLSAGAKALVRHTQLELQPS
jgi:hypothetical protein